MKTFETKKHVWIALRMALAAGVLSIILPAPLSVHAAIENHGLTVKGESASYTYSDDSNPILTVKESDSLTISNTRGVGSPVSDIIVIDTNGKTANITLSGVNIDASGNAENYRCAFRIAEGSGPVNITLADGTTNTLKSGENCAGLQKETTAATTMLTISGNGTLNATGGSRGAGIGGVHSKDVSYITIDSGTVNATGGSNAAGIGSGDGWISGFEYAATNGSHITINGGTVTARDGGSGAAGIGGGSWGNGSDISITGGTVNASSGTGAGIGGGTSLANRLFIGGTGSNISISGGEVTAVSTQGGAGIGGGTGGKGENITISGGTVTATSTFGGAGIGGGSGAIGSGITISGGTVTATDGGSTECGAGIGGGSGAAGTGILITGGTVIATGGKGNNGIGGGKGSSGSSSTIQPAAGLLATYEGTGTSGTLTNIILNPAQKAYTDSTRYIKICTGSLSSSPTEATVNTGGSQNFIANLSNSKITDSVTTYSGNTSATYNGVSWSVASKSSSNTNINSSGVLSIGNDESITPLTVTATLNGTSLTANSRVNVTGIQYTVNFAYNMSGHSGDAATSQTVTSGNKLTTPNVPSVAGYTFSGWYKEPECTNIWDFDADTVTSSRTLYAKWNLTTYNIAYELNGGTNVASNPTEYTVLSDNVALASPSKQGNTFTGWTYDAVTTPQLNAIIAKGSTGNKTFTANWAVNTYAVTLEANGGTGSDLTSYTYGTTTVLPTDYKKTGYTFAGWYDNQEFTGRPITALTSDKIGKITLYAKWVSDDVPDTGDKNNALFWTFIFLISSCAAVITIRIEH